MYNSRNAEQLAVGAREQAWVKRKEREEVGVNGLWAVHLADGVLSPLWLLLGFAVSAVLFALAARNLPEEQIPRIGVSAAAMFVASSLVHIPIPPTSVHLLLNGLAGVLLGIRCVLAIAVVLLLQVLLLGHGGFTTWGINVSIQAIPALLGGWLFRKTAKAERFRHGGGRWVLVAGCVGAWLLALAVTVEVLTRMLWMRDRLTTMPWSAFLVCSPLGALTIVVASLFAAWGERRLEIAPLFPLGLALGGGCTLLTCLLNALVLLSQGEDWRMLAIVVLAAHLPVVAVEGLMLGFLVGFLQRVRPELLRLPASFAEHTDNHDTPARSS